MTIMVTGGAGFIGSHYVHHLLSSTDHQVVILDKLTYAGNGRVLQDFEGIARLKFVKGDISDSHLVEDLLTEYCPFSVIHFAAETHVDRAIGAAENFIQTNVVGTYRLLNSTYRWWSELSPSDKEKFRFIHISTDEVYGSLEVGEPAFTEQNSYRPNNLYAASKAASDHLARSYVSTYNFPVIITNCSNNYGPRQFPEKLIPVVIIKALSGMDIPVYGDGNNIRDWLYVDDHCKAISSILAQGRVGQTYNIGGKNELKNIDVVQAVCAILDKKHPRQDGQSYRAQIQFVEDRLGHDFRYAMDISKISRELGWVPEMNFMAGLEKTVVWYLDNPDWIKAALTKMSIT